MPWNVGINSKTGECCSCDKVAIVGPCEDCSKIDEPPKTICECPKDTYSNQSVCEKEAGDCRKCVLLGSCDALVPGTIGSFGCYTFEDKICNDYSNGCRKFSELKEDACYKIVKCETQKDECFIKNACYQNAKKTCADVNWYDLEEAKEKCGEQNGDPLQCIDIELPECESLTCYSCKFCTDFGLLSSPSCASGFVSQLEKKCGKDCYRCVPAECDCKTAGYENEPVSGYPCAKSTTSNPLPFPCGGKICYEYKCKTCEDNGFKSSRPDASEAPPCEKVSKVNVSNYCTPPFQYECENVICYDFEPLTCTDCVSLSGSGSSCANSEAACKCDQYFNANGVCDNCSDANGNECIDKIGGCKGLCERYCGFKITGWSFQITGNPACDTKANLSFNGNCTAATSAGDVAYANMSGSFSVQCPSSAFPCVTQSIPWSNVNGGGGGSLCNTSYTATFDFEDCSFSPYDGRVFVTLARCKDEC